MMAVDGFLEEGGVTSPQGFVAGAAYAGIKTYGDAAGRLDVALLASDSPEARSFRAAMLLS